MFTLPARFGGPRLENPEQNSADFEYQNSVLMTGQLTDAIYNQCSCLQMDEDAQETAKKELANRKSERFKMLQEQALAELSAD